MPSRLSHFRLGGGGSRGGSRHVVFRIVDTACLDAPKVALVATLASVSPASPFVFRNYELSPDKEVLSKEVSETLVCLFFAMPSNYQLL